MFNINDNPFESVIRIPESAKVIFVSDMFIDDYVGGAELTSEALIKASPYEVFRIHSKHVSMRLLEAGHSKFWIFGNFAQMNTNLIPAIVTNLKYAVLEYDYKYCRYRSPEKHQSITGAPCDCHDQINGKMISAFYYGAQSLWWMSEKQRQRYHTFFPFLSERPSIVLSSVFDDETLAKIKVLRETAIGTKREGWIVLGSDSWIKGTQDAVDWCRGHGKRCEVINGMSYDETLAKLAHAEGFVYHPKGGDTCPRMVIEAKLLSCQLHLNSDVQHADEEWFNTDDLASIEGYLFAAKQLFWNGIKHSFEYRPTVSGYTTTYNCVSQEYPLEQCIRSMLQFCDEVCVVDGASTDSTQSVLLNLQKEFAYEPGKFLLTTDAFALLDNKHTRVKVNVVPRDWNHPRFAVFDGMQKAEARKMCMGDFCWQMDCDEVVSPDDVPKIRTLVEAMPKDVDIVSLPVVEYWGGADKVRIDVQPWKWRLSRNAPHITHGIPIALRRIDDDGFACAAPGTDGCDMIHVNTGEPLPHVAFLTQEMNDARMKALMNDPVALATYEQWFNAVIEQLPCVFHYSWIDLKRKMRLYRDYWTAHWEVLRGDEYEDTAETNMMFDVPWSDVTDEMMTARANELSNIGGWVWHRKWHGEKTPWITVKRVSPMKEQGK